MNPFFLLKIIRDSEYVIFNPVDSREYEVNYNACRILEECDGRKPVEVISGKLAKDSGITHSEAMAQVTAILGEMTRLGMIAWKEGTIAENVEWSPPSTVFWDVTERCNLRCAHCYCCTETPVTDELSTGEALRVLDEMSACGVKSITFSGGEPLLRQDFLELAEYAGSLGFPSVGLATNGTLIDRKSAKRLQNAGLSVQVSIDGDCSAVHDRIRGVEGAFSRAIRGIKILLDQGMAVSVCTTATNMNVDRIPAIIELMHGLGVESYRVQGMLPIGRGSGNAAELRLAPSRMKLLVEYLENRNIQVSSYNFTLRPPPGEPVDYCTGGGCSAANSICSITAEGNVVPCTYFWGMNGDSLRNRSFRWIWENSRLLNYFRGIRLGDVKGLCRDCEWLSLCHGGCKAENYLNGDIFDSNSNCWVADETRCLAELQRCT